MLALDAGERLLELGVVQQHRRAAVVDDVADLLAVQPEVDRHEHPAEPAHAEEADEQAGAFWLDDRHPLARPDAALVERGGLGAGQLGDAAVRERAEAVLSGTTAGLVRLVDHTDAIGVDELRLARTGQRSSEARACCRSTPASPVACAAGWVGARNERRGGAACASGSSVATPAKVPGGIDELVKAAQEAADQGFTGYWLPQIFGIDALTALAVVGREVPGSSWARRSSRPTRATR